MDVEAEAECRLRMDAEKPRLRMDAEEEAGCSG